MPGRRLISSGSKFEELGGYSRAVVVQDWIFLSATAGYDPATGSFPADVADQTRRALQTIADALAEADSVLDDVVRVGVFVADPAHVLPVSRVLGKTFAMSRPANTTVVCGFAVPEIQVELEVTALRHSRPEA